MFEIQQVGTVGSVLDSAWEAVQAGRMGIFDSMLAEAQTSGRGQYRREWVSPKGNIYAALRLPQTDPFLGTESAVALGAWIARALSENGYLASLKWPNDVVIEIQGQYSKVCGILLESRGNAVMAGIGVNVSGYPDISAMRESTALPAGSLKAAAEAQGLPDPTVEKMWDVLLKSIYSFYTSNIGQLRGWKDHADCYLLWRDLPVTLVDGEEQVTGILRGVGPKGELILETDGVSQAYLRGSIRFCG